MQRLRKPLVVCLPKHSLVFILVLLLLCAVPTGCSILVVPIDTMQNRPMGKKPPLKSTRASETVTRADLSDDIFVGIALSGGGSRAANFSAAVLLELEDLGLLSKATALSSVSGSSLPAAYYGLYGRDKKRWNRDEIRHQLLKDFESRWFGRWFFPHNILLYWYTNFNRSDIMKETLDANLFHGRTFSDLGSGPPRILINATTLAEGKRFVFSEERFAQLHSRIDTFPIANAVMASSAYPGAFHDMTLKDYSTPDTESYEHVIDGGPSDNLGTTTLLDMAAQLYRADDKPKGCFLFVVDAYPGRTDPVLRRLADTRQFFDFFFARNVSAASDALLSARRFDLLHTLNIYPLETGIDPFQLNTGPDAIYPDPYDYLQIECAVWHLSLQRLYSEDFGGSTVREDKKMREELNTLAEVVNSIPTRFKLVGDGPSSESNLNSSALQDQLFKAVHYLIHLDKSEDGTPILKQVCDWFALKGARNLRCAPAPQERSGS